MVRTIGQATSWSPDSRLAAEMAALEFLKGAMKVIEIANAAAAAPSDSYDAGVVIDTANDVGAAWSALVATLPGASAAAWTGRLYSDSCVGEDLWPTPAVTTNDRRVHIDGADLHWNVVPALVERLLPACVTSGFGDVATQTTRVDAATRRRSMEFAAADMVVHEDILRSIEASWARSGLLPRAVEARPNKLLVYREGDHFAAHRDTPTASLVGTAVLCLAREYGVYGKKNSALRVDKREFVLYGGEVLLFYPDIVHEVTPLCAGEMRVVLTFELHAREDAAAASQTAAAAAAASTDLPESFVRDALGALSRQRCGVLCAHKYQLLAGLRGADLALAQRLAAIPGVRVRGPVPCVVSLNRFKHCEADAERSVLVKVLSELADGVDLKGAAVFAPFALHYTQRQQQPDREASNPRALTRVELENSAAQGWRDEDYADDDDKSSLTRVREAESLSALSSLDRLELHYSHDEGAEYTGNESRAAEKTSVYLEAVIIVESATFNPAAAVRDRESEDGDDDNENSDISDC